MIMRLSNEYMQNVYMRTISLFLINVVMLLFSLSGRAATDPVGVVISMPTNTI